MGWQFNYTKLIVENIGKVVPAVLLLITGLTSAFGYVVNDNLQKDEEKNQAVHEVATAFQTALVVSESEPELEPVITKGSCDWCKEEIIKLKRWHK